MRMLADPTIKGFKAPVVENQMVFTFTILQSFSVYDITNVQPFFGTDGAFRVPEPSSVLLLGSGLMGLGLWSWRWRRRGDSHA